MPEPMNSRTGWWRSPGFGGASTRSCSSVHVYDATVTPYLRASSQNVNGSNVLAIASRAPPAIAPPMLIISPDG
jgi:hypothetical protein